MRFMRNMQLMPTLAILGASGLRRAGDARPGAPPPGARGGRARLGLARGPVGLGARRAAERLAAGVRLETTRRSPRGADLIFALPRQRAGGRVRAARPAPSSSISPARTASDASLYPAVVRLRASRGRELADWSYAIPELSPPDGPLIANPGCYATAAILALAPLVDAIDQANVVVDAKSGVSGAGRELKASSHAGFVLENVSPYRVGTHQHAPEIAQALGFPVCFVPHLLPVRRGLLATCYVRPTAELRGAARGRVRVERRRARAAGGRRTRSSRASSTPTRRDRALRGSRRPGTRSSSARSTTSARAPRGRRSRTRTSRSGSTRRSACGSPECSYERHCCQGFRRERRPLRDPQAGPARPRARALARARDRRGHVHRQPHARRAGDRLPEHLALAQPQAVVTNSGVANAATGERGMLDARATAAETAARARSRRRGGTRALDRRHRRRRSRSRT